MSNLNNTNANEQLFVELTSEEGSTIAGGTFSTYSIGNKYSRKVSYWLKYVNRQGKLISKKFSIDPGKIQKYVSDIKPYVTWDRDLSKNYSFRSESLGKKTKYFELKGRRLFLD